MQSMVNGDMPFELCQPSECGLGMSLDFVDPVFSGKYSWMFVSTAPVAVLFVMSFTVPCEKVSSGACVVVSCGGWSLTPDGTYDSVWDCVWLMIGRYTIYYFQYQGDVGCVCMLNDWIAVRRNLR